MQTKLNSTQEDVISLLGDVESLADSCEATYSGMIKIAESCPALSAVLEEGNKENIVPNENASVASLIDSSSKRRELQKDADVDSSSLTISPSGEESENQNNSSTSSGTSEPYDADPINNNVDSPDSFTTDAPTSLEPMLNDTVNDDGKREREKNTESTVDPTELATFSSSNVPDIVSTGTGTSTVTPIVVDSIATNSNNVTTEGGKDENPKNTSGGDESSFFLTAAPSFTDTIEKTDEKPKNITNIDTDEPTLDPSDIDVTSQPTASPTDKQIMIKMPEIKRPNEKPKNITNIATYEPILDAVDNYTYPPDEDYTPTSEPTSKPTSEPTSKPTSELTSELTSEPTSKPTSNNEIITLPPGLPNDFTLPPGIPNNFTIPDEIPKDFVIPPNFTIPPNLNLPSGLTADMDEFVSLYTEMSKSLQTYSSETNGYLEMIDDYVEAIKSAISITSTINTSMESVSVWFNSSLSFVGIVCFLTLIFIIRVVVSPKKRPEIDEDDNDEFNDDTGSSSSNSKFSCWINFQTYVLIPLYFICMLLLLIFTCGFAIAIVANADFCSGSPENNIMAVAEKFELKENDEEIYKGKYCYDIID